MCALALSLSLSQNKQINLKKEGDYIMTKVSIYQEVTVILNAYAPNKSAAKHVQQKLIELIIERDRSIITVK